jgi:hypothetical protein
VKNEQVCSCALCEERGAQCLRAAAVNSVGLSPGDHLGFTMRIAS